MDKLILLPYLLAVCSLLASLRFVLKQEHITVPSSSIWWPLKYPLGVILIDKSLLTLKGKELHQKVVKSIWWFVRFTVLGLLMGITYAQFI